ncbi:MAG TPA: DUF47 family protein [Candidatus Limnocylindrales bacterium]|nr:DUF47 family protein [Candidatus Limnocylindrales bacterium]
MPKLFALRALFKSNDRRFVQLLCQQADLAVSALEVLERYATEPGPHAPTLAAVKEIERAGDEVRRVLIDELLHTYATPFDREDLFGLSRSIDDILDAANETIIELAMYRLSPPENFKEMTNVLHDGARHVRASVGELLDHPRVAAEHAVRAKRSENRIDSLYHQALSNLLDSSMSTGTILKIREIYRHLKNSADCIDRSADEISAIVIKRT